MFYFFIPVANCEVRDCLNGGECVEGTCVCLPNWKGPLCNAPAPIGKLGRLLGLNMRFSGVKVPIIPEEASRTYGCEMLIIVSNLDL